jgi:Mannan-binding protein
MRRFLGFLLTAACAGAAFALVGSALPAQAQKAPINVEAGPIWNQADAQTKCPQIASANDGTWDGQWHTTVPGRMSVCEVRFPSKPRLRTIDVEAGPIWNQSDAQTKCPQVAKAIGGAWDGQWRTTVPGRMSVCEIRVPHRKG